MSIKNKVFVLCALLGFGLQAMAQMDWHNPMNGDEPFICGRAWNVEIGRESYARFPERFKADMPASVWGLSRQSAGLMVRFRTTSPTIQIKYVLPGLGGYKNMAPLNHSGVDLYATDAHGETHWIGNHMGWDFQDTITITYKDIVCPSFGHRGLEYQLYLSPYNTTKMVEVGVNPGSEFVFLPQSAERPIVVYGSSIVQGASPSRPGLMWTNIVQREMDYPVINLGFSGSAMMEPALFNAMSEIDARVFVLDPMPNSHSLKAEVFNRMTAGVRKLREKSDAPILLMEASASTDSVFMPELYRTYRRSDAFLRKAFETLQAEGVKGLYYLSHHELALGEESWMEGVHPNDLGNREYANAVEKKLAEILSEDKPETRFKPVRQHRDGLYEWALRHNEVIHRNHTINPEILMIGNSITHFWGGEPKCDAYSSKSWHKLFGKYRVTNMGFGWDRIENVYWRIFHGELEGCKPKAICLNIGINNLVNGDSEEDIVQGIMGLASQLRTRQPQAKLYVFAPYPCRGREDKVAKIATLLKQQLTQSENVTLVDMASELLLKDGSNKIDETLFRDGLHPNDKGYERISKAFGKVLEI